MAEGTDTVVAARADERGVFGGAAGDADTRRQDNSPG